MKRYLFLALLILWPSMAMAALSSATNWELRGNGSDTNGGGFAIGISTNLSKTDLVVDASNSLQVTSATYIFTSADVGRWLQITAGTGWTVGYYQVISVTGIKATLNRSPAALSTTGGSFTVYWGLDYSQQNGANANGGSNGSSVLAVAAGTTTITCADCSFTHDIIGNVAYFSGGSGSIAAQRRAITGWTNSTTITIDTAIAASTGMTINIGGALATMNEILGARGMIASNIVWWKNDVGISSSSALSSTVGGSIYGYNATRGDMDGAIGSTSRPTLTFTGTAAYALTFTTGTWKLRNFIVNASSGAGANGISTTTGSTYFYNLTVKNYDSIGFNLVTSPDTCIYCEATGGTANALEGILVNGSGMVMAPYVHDGNGPGIRISSQGEVRSGIVANQAGATADGIVISSPSNQVPIVANNTVYNSGRHGINITTAITTLPIIIGNILANNVGFGIAFPSAQAASPLYDGNAFYSNTLGTRSNMDSSTATVSNPLYSNVNDIILSSSPFVNAAGGNFALNATAGGGASVRDAGVPRAWPGSTTVGYPDVGAVFHQDPGTITITPNCGF